MRPQTSRRSRPPRFNRWGRKTGKRRFPRLVAVLALVVLVVGIGAVFLISRNGGSGEPAAGTVLSKQAILALWTKGEWASVSKACGAALASAPLDPFFLGIRGLSLFFDAMDLPEGEERAASINSSIIDLRKALAVRISALQGRIPRAELEYVLAKAYFHKGSATMDLAAKYMESALRQGYGESDGHEYLAMSYASLGEVAKALSEFNKALASDSSALLKIAAAKEQLAAGNDQEGERLLLEASNEVSDAVARENARLLLAGYYFDRSRWDLAEGQAAALLTENPDSAEAHHRLGLIYQVKGDPVHARAEWRKAVAIDPMHSAARQKLAEKQ